MPREGLGDAGDSQEEFLSIKRTSVGCVIAMRDVPIAETREDDVMECFRLIGSTVRT
jgi:hypothetical protein